MVWWTKTHLGSISDSIYTVKSVLLASQTSSGISYSYGHKDAKGYVRLWKDS